MDVSHAGSYLLFLYHSLLLILFLSKLFTFILIIFLFLFRWWFTSSLVIVFACLLLQCHVHVHTCIVTSSAGGHQYILVSPHQTCPRHDSHMNLFLQTSLLSQCFSLTSFYPVYFSYSYFWLGEVSTREKQVILYHIVHITYQELWTTISFIVHSRTAYWLFGWHTIQMTYWCMSVGKVLMTIKVVLTLALNILQITIKVYLYPGVCVDQRSHQGG